MQEGVRFRLRQFVPCKKQMKRERAKAIDGNTVQYTPWYNFHEDIQKVILPSTDQFREEEGKVILPAMGLWDTFMDAVYEAIVCGDSTDGGRSYYYSSHGSSDSLMSH